MSMPNLDKMNYCITWIDICNNYSDIDFQRRCWFRMEGPEVGCYEDDFAHLMLVAEMLSDEEYQEYLTPELNKRLKELVARLDAYDQGPDTYLNTAGEDDLLSDPKWLEIAAFAKETKLMLEKFLEELKDGHSKIERR